MKMKNNSFDKYTFNEEVSELELYDKSDVDDLIYIRDNKYRRRINFLIFLSVLLIIISLLLCLFGLYCSNMDYSDGNSYTEHYNLFITHSNEYFGRNGVDFKDYPSSDKYLKYVFKIANNNKIDLKYNIFVKNPFFGTDGIDMSKINFKLLIDGLEISSGNLENSDVFKVCNYKINDNSSQDIVLKLWSNDSFDGKKFSFKMSVES